jgi:hypothetical protein
MDESRLPLRGRHPAHVARAARATMLLLAAIALPACAVRLISERDEALVAKIASVHEQLEALFLSLEDAALTPEPADGAYGTWAQAYKNVLVVLRGAEVHAGAMPRSEIVVEQVGLLRASVQSMRDAHRDATREFSVDLLRTLREPVEQQIRAILTLQQALER